MLGCLCVELTELQAPVRPCDLRRWSDPFTKETHRPAVGWVSRPNDHAELAVRAKHGAAYTSHGHLIAGWTCTPCQAGQGSPNGASVARVGWQGARCKVKQHSHLCCLLPSTCNECRNSHTVTPLCCSPPSTTLCTGHCPGLQEESCSHMGLGLSSALFTTKPYLSWWEWTSSDPANHYCRENFHIFLYHHLDL